MGVIHQQMSARTGLMQAGESRPEPSLPDTLPKSTGYYLLATPHSLTVEV